MRAKTINEIKNFERGIDPKHAMGIGKITEIKKQLDEIFEVGKKYASYQYQIHSLDHIEVEYSDLVKKDMEESKTPDRANRKWILKYVEKDSYFFKEGSVELGSSTHSFGTEWSWYMYGVSFPWRNDPFALTFDEDYMCKLSMKNKENKEKMEIMVDALNQKYGKIGGFELIEKIGI